MTSPAAPSGGSAAAAGDGYFFKVQVLEGRGFGEEPQALLCCAAFAGWCRNLIWSSPPAGQALHHCKCRHALVASPKQLHPHVSDNFLCGDSVSNRRLSLETSWCPAGDSKSTQYSVSTDAHVWNCSLTWRVSKDELRKAQASGSSHCKLTVLRKDGSKLGWAVVSLRSAKLQSQYKSDPTGTCASPPACTAAAASTASYAH